MGVLIDLPALSPFKLNGIQDVYEVWGGTVEWQLLKPNLQCYLAPTLILNLSSCQPVFLGIGFAFPGELTEATGEWSQDSTDHGRGEEESGQREEFSLLPQGSCSI